MFLRKYLSLTILLSVRKNICLWEGDLCQNVPCNMATWLFDIVVESFGSHLTIRCFGCLQFVNSLV